MAMPCPSPSTTFKFPLSTEHPPPRTSGNTAPLSALNEEGALDYHEEKRLYGTERVSTIAYVWARNDKSLEDRWFLSFQKANGPESER